MARKTGSKKLENVGYGSKVNKYGLRFTKSEIKAFKNEVQRVNKRLRNYINKMQQIRQSNKFSVDSRIPVEPIFNKKSTSLQRFTSKDEFRSYISKMRKQGSDSYLTYRYNTEKSNFKKAISSTFNPQQSKILIQKINSLSSETLHNAFISKRLEHTGYVYYDPENAKFNKLLSQLEDLVA